MKKTLALILAFALVLAFTVPALASGVDNRDTVLTYNVNSSYTVVISPTVTISTATGQSYGTGTCTATVNAGSLIDAGTKLTFTITAATNYGGTPAGFRLKNASGTDVYLGYTIQDDATPTPNDVIKDQVFFEATPEECNAGKSMTLTVTTDTFDKAGVYSDTITITVATPAA